MSPDGRAATGSIRPYRRNLPIVAHYRVEIGPEDCERGQRLARRLLVDQPLLRATAAFGTRVRPGLGPWPALLLEDHSWISLFGWQGDTAYGYRALLLAADGDLVVIGTSRNRAFERYCREALRLGQPEILVPRNDERAALAVRCANDPALTERVAKCARECGGINLVPYMGTGGVWRLAAAIADQSGTEVKVAAAPPRLTRAVNDKIWFSRRVFELFGARARPETFAVFGLAALTARVDALAKRHAGVAVKLADSASSAGNVVLDPEDLRAPSLSQLRELLVERLRLAGWQDAFPLLVTAWEQPVLASPSVQLWISGPEPDDIAIEGIFDQSVTGKSAVFCGALPTRLSPAWQQRLALEAARLGQLFQALGYFGRCSFDAILVGDDAGPTELHWVECNGRWGGTSIPMTLANRLVEDWHLRPFVIIERADLDLPPRDLEVFLRETESDLFLAGERAAGAVVLSPSRLEAGTGFELMVLDHGVAAASGRADAMAKRLAGG